ncbi:MAG: DUF115 domain-containing protein [Candidatus Altiarchaeales archaeon]|nr:DUF115 domain-containing protein [Candidatus Altiarchaeales archaeon]
MLKPRLGCLPRPPPPIRCPAFRYLHSPLFLGADFFYAGKPRLYASLAFISISFKLIYLTALHWTTEYLDRVRELDLNIAGDAKASRILESLLGESDLGDLSRLISGYPVLICGCGPSLENDLHKIVEHRLHERFVLVAVDGAVKGFLDYRIVPHINVTDLDGDVNSILRANSYGCITVVHAHGDNIDSLSSVVPHLEGRVLGTTQHRPTPKLHNFGGFTDGDRACYLVDHFKPSFIVLAGMDFGSVVGVYSHSYNQIKKPRKLRIGKKLIQELASKSPTRFFNVTSSGEHIEGVRHISFEKLSYLI